MSAFFALVKKEIGSYFLSPIAYVVFVVFLLICGLAFAVEIGEISARRMPVRYEGTMLMIATATMLVSPFITMRLLAEEKHKGTIEPLMSVPVSEFQIVFSKFVSSLLFYVYILLPTIVYALLLSGKASIDVGEIISSYIGLILFASAIFSIGLFISSLCSNQISAGIITLAVIMFIIMLGIFQAHYIKNETIAGFLSYINVLDNIKPFFRGILDSRSVIFFLSVVVFFIFLSVRIMESKRWM